MARPAHTAHVAALTQRRTGRASPYRSGIIALIAGCNVLIITYELQPYPALCRSFLLVLVLCSGLACCIITSSLSASAVAKGQSSAFSRVWYSHGFRMAVYILLAVEGGVAALSGARPRAARVRSGPRAQRGASCHTSQVRCTAVESRVTFS